MQRGSGDRAGDADASRLGFRCVVLDHDDTVVDSTPTIHYPAYRAVIRELRPGAAIPPLEDFYRILQRGLTEHLVADLGFSAAEVRAEERLWRAAAAARVPPFHAGVLDILWAYRRRGGILAVVSHSDVEVIRRDYAAGAPGLDLAAIYGWDQAPERRKPSAYPLVDLMARLGLAPTDVLVVDDLLPGAVMAGRAGCAAAAAGWAHRIPDIAAAMRGACDHFLASPADLGELLLPAGGGTR
jgi:beta-phosphoglucomutase-like phosphatase (HAD superfamily)